MFKCETCADRPFVVTMPFDAFHNILFNYVFSSFHISSKNTRFLHEKADRIYCLGLTCWNDMETSEAEYIILANSVTVSMKSHILKNRSTY